LSTTGAARLLAAGAAWRFTGARPAGRALVGGLVTGDEAERAVAGIALTKAGDRSVPLLAEALADTARPEPVVDVLASIGTPAARNALRRAAEADSPAAGAAARALRTLDDIDDL
jgi:hypothetical protein